MKASGSENWVPWGVRMVWPYFEGAKSIAGIGAPKFEGFRGFLG